jgi:cobalt-precorrin 5A hydrolase
VNRLLIIAASKGGAQLARRLRLGLEVTVKTISTLGDFEVGVVVPLRYVVDDEAGYPSGGMAKLWQEQWESCHGIIFIGAAGIAVRMVAPLLEGKFLDPAVIVIDEAGRHAISLLSGHWGGGNSLTLEVATIIGADPVITTATDTLALPAFDVIAKEQSLVPVPFTAFRQANAAIVNGDSISIVGAKLPGEWPEQVRFYQDIDSVPQDGSYTVAVGPYVLARAALSLVPKCIFAGIGCRRGISPDEIQDALLRAFNDAGCHLEALAGVATITLKADEAGLLAAVDSLGLPVTFYTSEELAAVDGLHASDFVRQIAGCAGVSEQAAYLASGQGSVLLRRQVYGRVTVALALGA